MMSSGIPAAPVRTQIIHINSYNRLRGTPDDFVISLGHGLLKTDSPGHIMLEPVQCVINRSWQTVDQTNNLFQIYDGAELVDVVIPSGWYNVKNFLQALQALLADFSIGWSPTTNRYIFHPPNDTKVYRFIFSTWACSLMGFNLGTELECSYNNPLESDLPVKMTHESVVLVHTDLPRQHMTAVDNLLTEEMRESDILLKIPITTAPFDNLVWRANSTGICKYTLATQNITELRIWLTDEFDRPLKAAYDWTMTLRVEYYADETVNQVENTLSNIRDYLRYMVLSGENFLNPNVNKNKKRRD
jgi:hypothetical protein